MVDSVMERAGQGQLDMATLAENIRQLAAEWAGQRAERQRRRALDPADFDRLREAGFHLVPVPVEFGGLWTTAEECARDVCEVLRTLAHVDSSVALVCSMHPAVLTFSAEARDASAQHSGWEEQRRWIFQTVLEGCFWGPIVSEPGSGGDTSKTAAVARPAGDGRYFISGLKHFGTGSGIMAFADTAALVEGEGVRASFFLDMRGVPWDGSAGVKLAAEWDGHGMTATQSHAFEFSDFPAVRSLRKLPPTGGLPACLWSAITLGIVEEALAEARRRLESRKDSLRPFEKVEWSNAEMDVFLMEAAYEAMLSSVESKGREGSTSVNLLGKAAIAQLAETTMTSICRVMGGSAFSRQLPFGYWFEDVRALGFLRPPWGLAYDQLYEASWR